jgi:hypothetical protein
VIASHYAQPVARVIAVKTPLREAPSDQAPVIGELVPGDPLAMLDLSLGWAWGYAGEDRRVGYVKGDALGAA